MCCVLCADGVVQEEDEWEDELMASLVDGIGWVIKAHGQAGFPVFKVLALLVLALYIAH
jgi:hypothetical protein